MSEDYVTDAAHAHFEQLVLSRTGKTAAQLAYEAAHAHGLEIVRNMPTPVRKQLTQVVGAKIREGVYENDLKLDIAVDRLLDVLME